MPEVTVAGRSAALDFDSFVESRGPALLRTAWLLTGDRQRAEDLVQTALAKTWPRWDRIAAEEAQGAYVRKVMLTTYIAWWKRRWNAEVPTDSPPERPSPTTESDVDARADLMRALASLPRGQRAVVVLRYFEDLTESQTAEVLGCSVGTVKSQTARAMAALRRSPLLVVAEGGSR